MAVIFDHRRTVDLAGSFPEDAPNTTLPPMSQVFRLGERPPTGQLYTTGHQIFFQFLDANDNAVIGPLVTFQTWFQDNQTRVWANVERLANIPAYDAYVTTDVRNADLFVQVEAVSNVGTATKMVIYVGEV